MNRLPYTPTMIARMADVEIAQIAAGSRGAYDQARLIASIKSICNLAAGELKADDPPKVA